jgi:disulfide bond formation protein DsbB
MPARPAKPCEDPTYLIPGLPISMAALNLLYALAFVIVFAVVLWRDRRVA